MKKFAVYVFAAMLTIAVAASAQNQSATQNDQMSQPDQMQSMPTEGSGAMAAPAAAPAAQAGEDAMNQKSAQAEYEDPSYYVTDDSIVSRPVTAITSPETLEQQYSGYYIPQ